MMKQIMNSVDKWLKLFEEWSIFLMVMTGLLFLFANVVLRYAFNYSLAWSEESIKVVLVYTPFIGLSVSVKNKSMVKVGVLLQFFPKTRFPLTVFSNLATVVFSMLMLVYGWEMAIQQATTGQTTIIMQIPMFCLYALIPLMGGLTLKRTFQVLYQDIV